MRRVVFNQKGGVGKTTITCNLAAAAASRGRRTLVVDLDAQANASRYLLGDGLDAVQRSAADYFDGVLHLRFERHAPVEHVWPTAFDNLHVLPADARLEELHGKLESRYKMYKLREALDSLDEFDEVFIDTPPALNFYTRSALIGAERCLVPFDCDDFSRHALYRILEAVDEIRADHNESLAVEGIVVNQFQARARLPSVLVEALRGEGHTVLEPCLGTSVKVRESHQRHTPLVFLEPRHKLARQYQALYDALAAGETAGAG